MLHHDLGEKPTNNTYYRRYSTREQNGAQKVGKPLRIDHDGKNPGSNGCYSGGVGMMEVYRIRVLTYNREITKNCNLSYPPSRIIA
jgi:hypothetical protein